MNSNYVLTIAVPTFNMAWCLEKNLETYFHETLKGRLEVLILNNASEDDSAEIAQKFCCRVPEIYTLIHRDSRGYGSSINEAIKSAQGAYFRIVDADDWVNTQELVRFVDALENCKAEIVLTDYQIVDMQTQKAVRVRADEYGIEYNELYSDFTPCIKSLPSIHNTTYRTAMLRQMGLCMQDNMFFVDEEYVVLPYLKAERVIYYCFDVYRYQVANPEQSTSPKNRGIYFRHREAVLKRLLEEYTAHQKAGDISTCALEYCRVRIQNGVGDHFTTLHMYLLDRGEGRKQAKLWRRFLMESGYGEFYEGCKHKERLLRVLNICHVSLGLYAKLKRLMLGRR